MGGFAVALGLAAKGLPKDGAMAPASPSMPPAPSMTLAQDGSVTDGFKHLATHGAPSLADIRKSVGFIQLPHADGSVVLLDEAGTVVLFAHSKELDGGFPVSFFPAPGVSCQVEVDIQRINHKQDFAFGTLRDAKSLIDAYGIAPAKWGELTAGEETGRAVLFTGFARGGPLHATLGKISHYEAAVQTTKGTTSCKIETKGRTIGGMSGGGVFRSDLFLGIVNSGTGGRHAQTEFTPVDAIREAYINFFPDRAARAGVSPLSPGRALPAECGFKPRQFIEASAT